MVGSYRSALESLGDAIVYALKLRHEHNAVYREAISDLGVMERCPDVIERLGELGEFRQGLFAATEMLVDGFMHLYQSGIIKRRVYDDIALQRLLNRGAISEQVSDETLDALRDERHSPCLTDRDVEYLCHWGCLPSGIRYVDGHIELADGERLSPDLDDPQSRARITAQCLGSG